MGMKEVQTTTSTPQTSKDTLNILRLDNEAKPPCRGSDDAAGYDLFSLQSYTILSNDIELIDTGIAVHFPTGTYGRIAGRSGLALKKNITVLGGVIGPNYTGSIKILLYNFGEDVFTVQKHDRVAQLILEKYERSLIALIDELPKTKRATKGFGSTGINISDPKPPSVTINKLTK